MRLLPRFWCIPPLRDSTDDELASDEIKLELSGYRQQDGFSCGPVAAWSVLQTFHPCASFQSFYRHCKITDDGTNEYQIIRALRKSRIGLSIRDEMTFAEVVETIDNGFPILTSITYGDVDHWVCIYGVGLSPARLFTCNNVKPTETHGRCEWSWEDWLTLWDSESRYLICWGK